MRHRVRVLTRRFTWYPLFRPPQQNSLVLLEHTPWWLPRSVVDRIEHFVMRVEPSMRQLQLKKEPKTHNINLKISDNLRRCIACFWQLPVVSTPYCHVIYFHLVDELLTRLAPNVNPLFAEDAYLVCFLSQPGRKHRTTARRFGLLFQVRKTEQKCFLQPWFKTNQLALWEDSVRCRWVDVPNTLCSLDQLWAVMFLKWDARFTLVGNDSI